MTTLYPPQLRTATIASGDDTSGLVQLGAGTLLAINVPTLTGTGISFLVGMANDDLAELYDDDNALYVPPFTAGKWFSLDPILFLPYKYMQIVSDATEGADRVIKLSVRQVA